MKFLVFLTAFFLFITNAKAECVPPEGGKCLTKDQFEAVKSNLAELDSIHKYPAVVNTNDEIIIIHDWNGRVYTNGGDKNPLSFKLYIGETIERDMAIVLPTKVYYRPKPPDPMFRLRIRAQVGLIALEFTKITTGKIQNLFDAGLGWDFFHYKNANVAVYTGMRSVGAGVGFDLTRNFGPYIGYSLVYDGFRSSAQAGFYMSFN